MKTLEMVLVKIVVICGEYASLQLLSIVDTKIHYGVD